MLGLINVNLYLIINHQPKNFYPQNKDVKLLYMPDVDLKPIIYTNRGYDYFKLDDHEFEEITYLIFKNEIDVGSWKGQYDNINWPDKVGERGRDFT